MLTICPMEWAFKFYFPVCCITHLKWNKYIGGKWYDAYMRKAWNLLCSSNRHWEAGVPSQFKGFHHLIGKLRARLADVTKWDNIERRKGNGRLERWRWVLVDVYTRRLSRLEDKLVYTLKIGGKCGWEWHLCIYELHKWISIPEKKSDKILCELVSVSQSLRSQDEPLCDLKCWLTTSNSHQILSDFFSVMLIYLLNS